MVYAAGLMIVEDDPKTCENFREAMKHYPGMDCVYETDSEFLALNYMESHPVDIMILDIELREGDGLSLLVQMEERKLKKPFILVVTNTQSAVTLSYLRSHGADYIYQKSNLSYSAHKVLSVIEKVYPYQQKEDQRRAMYAGAHLDREKTEAMTRRYIETELRKMGFRRRHVGFDYITEAIFLLLLDKEEKLHISSELYPLLAKKYETTTDGVERGIRNAIEAAFTGARMQMLHQCYPFPYDEERGRPTNTEFLKNMAYRLQI